MELVGRICTLRNGRSYLVLKANGTLFGIRPSEYYWEGIQNLNEDLLYPGTPQLDVMEIREPYCGSFNEENLTKGKLLWRRERA